MLTIWHRSCDGCGEDSTTSQEKEVHLCRECKKNLSVVPSEME